MDEFVAFIDKLINTIDGAEDPDCPTEKMEFLEETKETSREKTEKKRATPPPLPPIDDTSELEIDLFEDSLMPTQF